MATLETATQSSPLDLLTLTPAVLVSIFIPKKWLFMEYGKTRKKLDLFYMFLFFNAAFYDFASMLVFFP